MEQSEQLIPFLRKLADAIENKELAQVQLQSIGEFFMSYQFQEQAYKDAEKCSRLLHFVASCFTLFQGFARYN